MEDFTHLQKSLRDVMLVAKVNLQCQCITYQNHNYLVFKLSYSSISVDIEDIKKVVNCPMKDTTVPLQFWPQNYNMEDVGRRHSCVF